MSQTKAIEKMERNVARNNFLDRAFQGLGAAALVLLAYQDLLKHFVVAVYPMNYVLAAGFLVLIGYMILSPLFRR